MVMCTLRVVIALTRAALNLGEKHLVLGKCKIKDYFVRHTNAVGLVFWRGVHESKGFRDGL